MIDQLAIFLYVGLALSRHLANLKTHTIELHIKILFLIPDFYLSLDLVKSCDQVQNVLF